MLKTASINKQIFRLSTPNIISNFSVPLLGAVDTALMGRLDNKLYLGALGLGSIMFSDSVKKTSFQFKSKRLTKSQNVCRIIDMF